jgi:phage tail-like protein
VSMPNGMGSGRQSSPTPTDKGTLLTSAIFKVEAEGKSVTFSELTGIVSEVEQSEYMEAGAVGPMFSRHFGKTKPPTVTLKRALRTDGDNTWVWAWHQLARQGISVGGYKDCTLKLYAPGDDPNGAGSMSYQLVNAWPAKVEVAGMKAGSTEVVIQTLTLMCDEIFDPNAS